MNDAQAKAAGCARRWIAALALALALPALLVGGVAGWAEWRLLATERAAAVVRSAGGIADVQLRYPRWLDDARKLVGDRWLEPFAERFVRVDLSNTRSGPRELDAAARMPGLAELNLERTPVGDEAIVRLAGARKLKILDLSGTAVTDGGLAALAALPHLERLGLRNTAITNAGLATLKALPRRGPATLVYLQGTKVNVAEPTDLVVEAGPAGIPGGGSVAAHGQVRMLESDVEFNTVFLALESLPLGKEPPRWLGVGRRKPEAPLGTFSISARLSNVPPGRYMLRLVAQISGDAFVGPVPLHEREIDVLPPPPAGARGSRVFGPAPSVK